MGQGLPRSRRDFVFLYPPRRFDRLTNRGGECQRRQQRVPRSATFPLGSSPQEGGGESRGARGSHLDQGTAEGPGGGVGQVGPEHRPGEKVIAGGSEPTPQTSQPGRPLLQPFEIASPALPQGLRGLLGCGEDRRIAGQGSPHQRQEATGGGITQAESA